MAIINTLKIYELLKEKMPEQSAEVIAKAVEESFEEYRQNQKEFLATKEDLANLKAELIKWMFIFYIGGIATLVVIRLLKL